MMGLVRAVSVRLPAERLQGAVQNAIETLNGKQVIVTFGETEEAGTISAVRYYEERGNSYLWVTIDLGATP